MLFVLAPKTGVVVAAVLDPVPKFNTADLFVSALNFKPEAFVVVAPKVDVPRLPEVEELPPIPKLKPPVEAVDEVGAVGTWNSEGLVAGVEAGEPNTLMFEGSAIVPELNINEDLLASLGPFSSL